MTQASTDLEFSKRLPMNLVTNLLVFLLSIVVGIFLTPYFIDVLGKAAYGLIPLATSITSYVSLLIDILNSSVGRYLTIELQQGDYKKANESFNTAFFGTIGLIALIAPAALILAVFSPNIFNIGNVSPLDVILLMGFTFCSFLISTFRSNFMVTLFACNRLAERNFITIIERIVYISIILILFTALSPSLALIGISSVFSSIVALVIAFHLSKKSCPEVVIALKCFKKSRLKEITGLSFWLLINNLGALIRVNVALILVNVLCGADFGADYALMATWVSLLTSIGNIVTTTFTPMVYAYRAKEDRDGLIEFVKLSTKCTAIFIALPISLLCVFSPELLTIWVGPAFQHIAMLSWLLLPITLFQITSSCFYTIGIAYFRVQVPALVNLGGGILIILLGILFADIGSLGMYGVALATLLVNFCISGIYSPLYNSYIVKLPYKTLMNPMYFGFVCFIGLSIFGLTYRYFIPVDSIILLLIAGCIISLIYGILVLKLFLKKDEIDLICLCIPKRFARIIKTIST